MAYNQFNPSASAPLLPLPPSSQHSAPPPPPASSRRNRGARRRGRGGGAAFHRNDEVSIRPPRQSGSAIPPPTGPPRPTNLSSSATPERNDPLWTSGVAGVELQPMPNVEYIFPGAEALPTVTAVIHSSCVSASPGYARRVPESALSYYCGVTTYARMLQLQLDNGLMVTGDEERFVEQVRSLSLEVPMLLAHFLSGFGNTRVPSGRSIRFSMRERTYHATPLTSGWYGRVSPETQPLYQNYPSLGVYASRLLADLSDAAYTRHWILPAAIQPVEPGGLGASLALLGYGYRARLSPGQRSFLESSELFFNERFPSANPTLPLCVSLLLAVQNELNAISSIKRSPMPTSVVGSQAQLALIRFENELAPVADKPAVLECSYRLPAEIAFPASAFCYRVVHSVDNLDVDVVAPWVVWRYEPADDWNEYALVGNNYRGFEPDLLQIAEFRTTSYLVKARLEALERALTGAVR